MGGGDVAGTQGAVAEQGLKHLEFLHVAALHAAACVLNLYGYAKEKSGPLKPRVESVEGAVKTAVRPVFDKYRDGPIELLKFVDLKVDQSMVEINRRIPPVVKQVSSEALSAAHKAPGAARAAAAEVKGSGVVGTASEIAKSMYSKYEPKARELYSKYEPKAKQYASGVVGRASGMAKSVYSKYEPTARDLYSKYEPKAEQYAAAAWRRLNELPVFPQAANMVVPAASFCSDKYNEAVLYTAEKGYRVSTFLPLIPIERIAKVFRREMLEMEPLVARS